MYDVKEVKKDNETEVLSKVEFETLDDAERYFNLVKTSMINNPEGTADRKLILEDPENIVIHYFTIG